jgi:hypothetical protein
MLANIAKKLNLNRSATKSVVRAMVQYCQIRYMYEHGHFWEPAIDQNTADPTMFPPLGGLLGKLQSGSASSPAP